LNDEVFDENGNPSGGDGTIYSWTMPNLWTSCYVDGNNFCASGMFNKDEDAVGIFLIRGNMFEIKNLYVDNIYVVGDERVGAVCGSTITNVENVHCLGGTIKGRNNLYGLVESVSTIKNCTNKANIIQTEYKEIASYERAIVGICIRMAKGINCQNYGNISFIKAGFVSGLFGMQNANGEIFNCKNYGAITQTEITSGVTGYIGLGGIVASLQRTIVVSKCENYGEINANYQSAGGICGRAINDAYEKEMRNCTNYATNTKANGFLGEASGISMFNCENYGDIYYSSAFIGGVSGNIILRNCNNFGKLFSEKGIQGFYITTFGSANKVSVSIEDCKNYSAFIGPAYGWSGVIGYTGKETGDVSIFVKGFHHKVDYSQVAEGGIYIFLYSLTGNKSLEIENSVFEPINSTRSTFFVANTYKGASVEMKNIEIRGSAKTFRLMHAPQYARVKNVLINLDKNTNDDNICTTKYDFVYDGIIVKKRNDDITTCYYYGSDFSGFYVDFKTGEIGLKSHSGKGFFQGKVTEELLINRGFSKKS